MHTLRIHGTFKTIDIVVKPTKYVDSLTIARTKMRNESTGLYTTVRLEIIDRAGNIVDSCNGLIKRK